MPYGLQRTRSLFFLRCLYSDSPRRYWFLFMGLGFRFALGCILAEALLVIFFFFWRRSSLGLASDLLIPWLCCIFFEAFERPFFLLSSLCVVFFGYLSIYQLYFCLYSASGNMYDDCSLWQEFCGKA